jgi:hypothetical protein
MSDIESPREELRSLISKFEKDRNYYLSKGYPEAQVRLDFINPLFNALGWDIENKAQKPPHDRDVIVELSPETTKRPDYNFRINGATKFFVEAKAPSIEVFFTAFKALKSEEKEAFLERLISDPELREDIIDIALIERAKKVGRLSLLHIILQSAAMSSKRVMNKIRLTAYLFITFCCILFSVSESEAENEDANRAIVNSESLTVFSRTSSSSETVKELRKGDKVTV